MFVLRFDFKIFWININIFIIMVKIFLCYFLGYIIYKFKFNNFFNYKNDLEYIVKEFF